MVREDFDPYKDLPTSLGEKFLIVALIEQVRSGAAPLAREKRRILIRHLVRNLGGKVEYDKILGRRNRIRGE
jgi:hypothetical protein